MRITIFVPSEVHLLEVAGLCDAFFEANLKLGAGRPYVVTIVSEDGMPAASASGVKFVPDAGIENAPPCDTLIVTGPFGVPAPPTEKTARWLQQQVAGAQRYGSTCTGAFLLADAGLLSGRRVTTHWQYARNLALRHPDISVEPDCIFVRDGPVFSSAGVTTAMDLAFSLLEEDHGRALALWVARRLVVFLKRPGGQSQFSDVLAAQFAGNSPIDRIRLHIIENPRQGLGLKDIAAVVGMSPRQLSRLFQAELGMSVAAYVESIRVDIARGLLEGNNASIKTVARASGFGSTATLRRALQRKIGITPVEYRTRFRSTTLQDEAGNADGPDSS